MEDGAVEFWTLLQSPAASVRKRNGVKHIVTLIETHKGIVFTSKFTAVYSTWVQGGVTGKILYTTSKNFNKTGWGGYPPKSGN